jgi:hypothetical protein
MKRLLIFTALYPPVALAVFTAPDGFKNFLDWLVYAYPGAEWPAGISLTRITAGEFLRGGKAPALGARASHVPPYRRGVPGA